MKSNNIVIIIIIFITFAIAYMLGKGNREVVYENDNEEIVLELRAIRDSLLTVVESYSPADTQSINNYYIQKYEKETEFIYDNNIDSNIMFFTRWYNTTKSN